MTVVGILLGPNIHLLGPRYFMTTCSGGKFRRHVWTAGRLSLGLSVLHSNIWNQSLEIKVRQQNVFSWNLRIIIKYLVILKNKLTCVQIPKLPSLFCLTQDKRTMDLTRLENNNSRNARFVR